MDKEPNFFDKYYTIPLMNFFKQAFLYGVFFIFVIIALLFFVNGYFAIESLFKNSHTGIATYIFQRWTDIGNSLR